MFNDFMMSSLVTAPEQPHTVSKVAYRSFQKEYIFDALQGKTFACAFCEKFEVHDLALSMIVNRDIAEDLIETLGYIET